MTETVNIYADHVLTGNRRIVLISMDDFRSWNTTGARKRSAPWVTVHDLRTGESVRLRAAACGAACFCAAEWDQA